MRKMQEIFKKYRIEWADHVRVVGINVDSKKDIVINKIYSERWSEIEQYFYGPFHPEFEIGNELPFWVLINEKGLTAFMGNSKESDLEAFILKLLKGEIIAENKNNEDFKSFSKIMKKDLKILLKDVCYKKVIKNLKIKWSKEIDFDEKDFIVKYSYTKPSLLLSYNAHYEKEANALLNNIYNLIGKGNFDSIEINDKDKDSILEGIVKSLRKKGEENNITDTDIIFEKICYLEWQNDIIKDDNYRSIEVKCFYDAEKKDKMKNFSELCSKSQNPLLARINFLKNSDIFSYFIPFKVNEFDSNKEITLNHEKGKVFWLYFLSDFYETTSKYMRDRDEIFDFYKEKWHKKVRVIFISSNKCKDVVKKAYDSQKWKNLELYYLLDENKAKFFWLYSVFSSHSFCYILVNSNGKIIKNGGSHTINFEHEEINKLIDIKEASVKFTGDDRKKLYQLLFDEKNREEIGQIMKALNYKHYFNIEMRKTTTFDKDSKIKDVIYQNPLIKCTLTEADLNKILTVLQKFIEINQFKQEKNIFETFLVVPGNDCKKCLKKLIPTELQYYCHPCQLWYCEKCANTVDEKKQGNNSLVHPHNLIVVNFAQDPEKEPLKIEVIGKDRLGRNLAFKENIRNFHFSCNGCGNGPKGNFRYICLSCRPGPIGENGYFDLCQNCFNELRKKEIDGSVSDSYLRKKMEDDKHDLNTHLLYRIGFGDDYWNF